MPWDELHRFWFGRPELTESYYGRQLRRWFFGEDVNFDRECATRFAPWLGQAFESPTTPREHLAHILLLDQIPRNAFRGSPRAYVYDTRAQALALEALGTPLERDLSLPERIFLYMPLEHAEDVALQDLSVEKFAHLHRDAPPEIREWTLLGLRKAQEHRETILRHGRFPTRAV